MPRSVGLTLVFVRVRTLPACLIIPSPSTRPLGCRPGSPSKPKGGPRNAIRRTPIPPVLVRMIVEHVQAYGTAQDGRLFQTYRGGIYQPSTLWRVLQEARQRILTPAQLKSPLIHKPYDCRHGGVSWRLNAGVPAPLVAEWAGHTVEVLLRIYAHCIDGDDHRWFGPMEDALGGMS